MSCRNVAFTSPNISNLSLDDLYKIIGTPICEELIRLDGTALEPSLPKHLVEAAKWDDWIDEDDEDIRIFNFSESFPVDSKLQKLAQPSQLRAPETFFMDYFDCRIDLWRVGCVVRFLSSNRRSAFSVNTSITLNSDIFPHLRNESLLVPGR